MRKALLFWMRGSVGCEGVVFQLMKSQIIGAVLDASFEGSINQRSKSSLMLAQTDH